jgi:succinate dehydrogenase/fumarate reductase cytochrome b subunit
MLHTLHRTSAMLLAVFIGVHLLNHLSALHGIETHIAFMKAYRHLYRLRAVEALLLACVAFQIVSGTLLVLRRKTPREAAFDRLQAWSGLYLAFFMTVHVAAVMFGRAALGLDTNFYYGAAGLSLWPATLFFTPYYLFAVLAIAVHIACGLRWLLRKRLSPAGLNAMSVVLIGGGVLTGLAIVATLGGHVYPFAIPPAYQAQFR